MKKLILSEIWIYPIKSLGGIRLTDSKVFEKGLEHDRRWMLVNENNQFMTQRDVHKMSLFKQSLTNSEVTVSFANASLNIPFVHSLLETPIETKVWDDGVTVFEINTEYSEWFSNYLNVRCKLVAFPESGTRPVHADYKLKDEHVSLADAYPLLIIGQSSLDDLNSRLEEAVPMNRFRPNLVFTGGEPYEEESWRDFKIGANRFVGVKPCARCIVTTINQATGEKGREPLLTLSKYRRQGEKILFGQNVIPVDYNEIHEGEEITF
jgi:uncharacterized protein YcbX